MTSIASNRARGRRLGAVVVAILAFLPAGGMFFSLALYGLIYTCDEGCGAPAGGWTHSKSWVWIAQFVGLAVPASLAAVLFVWLIVVGRRRAAIFALAVVVAVTCGWIVLYAAGGHDFDGREEVIAICVALQAVGGAIAIRMAPTQDPVAGRART